MNSKKRKDVESEVKIPKLIDLKYFLSFKDFILKMWLMNALMLRQDYRMRGHYFVNLLLPFLFVIGFARLMSDQISGESSEIVFLVSIFVYLAVICLTWFFNLIHEKRFGEQLRMIQKRYYGTAYTAACIWIIVYHFVVAFPFYFLLLGSAFWSDFTLIFCTLIAGDALVALIVWFTYGGRKEYYRDKNIPWD